MSISKDRLILDTTNVDEADNVGAYIRAADGTLITKTTDGSKERLDVSTGAEHDAGGAVGSTDKGSLSLAKDSAGNYAPLNLNAAGELLVSANLTIASDFAYAEDTAHTSGDVGAFMLAVRNDANAAMTSADGDYSPIAVDEFGRVKIVGSMTAGAEKAEDAASASGDVGNYILSVRQDTLASTTSANGDFQSFKTDSVGSLWTRISASVAPDAPNTAILATAVVVGNVTAVALPTTALAARKKIIIENISTSANKAIYVGDSAVTAASGVRLSAGSSLEMEVGPSVSVYAIGGAAGCDVRVLEIA